MKPVLLLSEAMGWRYLFKVRACMESGYGTLVQWREGIIFPATSRCLIPVMLPGGEGLPWKSTFPAIIAVSSRFH